MNRGIFHIFRNTPLGRETLFQSMYFAQTLQIPLRIYIAQTPRFLMYFDQAVVQIDAPFFPMHALALQQHLGAYAIGAHAGGIHDDLRHAVTSSG